VVQTSAFNDRFDFSEQVQRSNLKHMEVRNQLDFKKVPEIKKVNFQKEMSYFLFVMPV
jgi:hypothetical protein